MADVVAALNTDVDDGLAEVEAARRLSTDGPNELSEQSAPGILAVLARQFRSVLLWILLAAIVLATALGDTLEAVAIAIITVFTVTLGFIQEYRAEKALQALRDMSAPEADVLRGGHRMRVAAREIVVGDVIQLAQGDVVPADARLLDGADLSAKEAALTGESEAVTKDATAVVEANVPLGERRTMVFASTHVVRGRGVAVVTATGDDTEVGRIGDLLATIEQTQTPLEKQLAKLGRWLAAGAIGIVILVVVLGAARGESLGDMLIFGVALAVAAVPEALPAVVTISLAIGARRMAKRNALVRRLPTVETLGSTTVICSDKTGTLTTGRMAVAEVRLTGQQLDVGKGEEVDADEQPGLREILVVATLCNDASLDDGGQGDPMEVALLELAARYGMSADELEAELPRVAEEPFSSETSRMSTEHQTDDGRLVLIKGAPEAVMPECTAIWTPDGPRLLDDEERVGLANDAQAMAEAGMRVLAFAHECGDVDGSGPTWLGLMGLRDPARPEAQQAIATCMAAGIRPIMITGDHPATAEAIAREIGLPVDGVVGGQELGTLDDNALASTVADASIFARVAPEDKLRIVAALQAAGHVVAMTGDGVNDGPALKQADIGVAMGKAGTAVAREAADISLSDDNFATIVAAVEEGRAIFDNIRKYLMYLLSTNLGELLLIAAVLVLGMPLPLSAVMILFVNLVSDGPPALALAVDPHEGDLMRRRPRRPESNILDLATGSLIVLGGVWSAAVNLGVFWWALGSGRPLAEAMTMTFMSLVLIQFVKAYVFRSERRWVLHQPFSNKWLNWAVACEIVLLFAIVYIPLLARPMGTYPLSTFDWLVVTVAALSILPVLEAAKWWLRQRAAAAERGAPVRD